MNPVSTLEEKIKNNLICATCFDTFKCRCCNDKMKVIKKVHEEIRGVDFYQTIKGKRKPFLRRRNYNQEHVDIAVTNLIKYLKTNKLLLDNIKNKVSKEAVANILEVPENQVKVSFHKLNLQGVLSQAINIPPHDSKRDFWGGQDSSWRASQYLIK